MESTSNFKNFEIKNHRHSQYYSELTDCEILGYTTLEKAPF